MSDKDHYVTNVMKSDSDSFWIEHEIRWYKAPFVRSFDNPRHPYHFQYQSMVDRNMGLIIFVLFPILWMLCTYGLTAQFLFGTVLLGMSGLILVAGIICFLFIMEIFFDLYKDVVSYLRGEI